MAKGYRDLSRKALIKLNEDFDADNDGALLDYLTKKEENGECYEPILFIEKATARIDTLKEKVSNTTDSIAKSDTNEAIKQAADAVSIIIDTVGDLKELAAGL